MTDNFCPYLGSVGDPMSCTTHESEDNLCYAAGQGAPISLSHQKKYCLGGKLTTCPHFPAEPTLDAAAQLPVPVPVEEEDLEGEEELEEIEDWDEIEVGEVEASLDEDEVLEDDLDLEEDRPILEEPLV